MGNKKKESLMQTLKKVWALRKEERATKSVEFISLAQLLKKKFKDMPVELEPQDWDLPSAEVIIDVGGLPHILNSDRQVDEENKILPFEVWWGCVYPKKRLFVLEFWHLFPDPFGFAKWATTKTFEMYLSPGNIRDLIAILQKGLEYLEKYSSDKQTK